MDKITRQSALPEGAEKELRKVETNRSNLRREQANNSREQADEKDVGLDRERNSDDIERDAVPPVPLVHHAHPPKGEDIPDEHKPENSEKDAENGGADPNKV